MSAQPITTSTSSRHLRRLATAGAAATGAAVLGLIGAGSAAAHVTVQPGEASAGGYEKIAFRVPNESDTASTVSLEVELPTDTPLTSVRLQPVQGWTGELIEGPLPEPVEVDGTTVTEGFTGVRWTADAGTGIEPGQFQEFPVSVGPLPEVEQLVLLATQTYSDGEVSAWVEETVEGEEEPEKPAPVLTLTEATGDGHHGGGDAEAETASMDDAAPAAATTDTGDGLARGLGGAGLAAGVVGLGLGAAAWRRSAARGSA